MKTPLRRLVAALLLLLGLGCVVYASIESARAITFATLSALLCLSASFFLWRRRDENEIWAQKAPNIGRKLFFCASGLPFLLAAISSMGLFLMFSVLSRRRSFVFPQEARVVLAFIVGGLLTAILTFLERWVNWTPGSRLRTPLALLRLLVFALFGFAFWGFAFGYRPFVYTWWWRLICGVMAALVWGGGAVYTARRFFNLALGTRFTVVREGLLEHHRYAFFLHEWNSLAELSLADFQNQMALVVRLNTAESLWVAGDARVKEKWKARHQARLRRNRQWFKADMVIVDVAVNTPVGETYRLLKQMLNDQDQRVQLPSWSTVTKT